MTAPLPKRAIIFGKRPVNVLHYDGNGFFYVLDRGRKVLVHRDNLTFLPPK